MQIGRTALRVVEAEVVVLGSHPCPLIAVSAGECPALDLALAAATPEPVDQAHSAQHGPAFGYQAVNCPTLLHLVMLVLLPAAPASLAFPYCHTSEISIDSSVSEDLPSSSCPGSYSLDNSSIVSDPSLLYESTPT